MPRDRKDKQVFCRECQDFLSRVYFTQVGAVRGICKVCDYKLSREASSGKTSK
jgi:hypothetical protein